MCSLRLHVYDTPHKGVLTLFALTYFVASICTKAFMICSHYLTLIGRGPCPLDGRGEKVYNSIRIKQGEEGIP